MNISENPALDQLTQFFQETDNSVLSVDQLRDILLSAASRVQETSYNTETLVTFAKNLASRMNEIVPDSSAKALEKILLVWEQALVIPDDSQISLDEAEVALEEAKPFLPPEITESVNNELETIKNPGNKVIKTIFVKFLECIIIPLAVTVIANQISATGHDRKEEAHWAVVEQYLDCLANSKDCADSQSEIFDEAVHIADSSIDSTDSEVESNN